MLQRIKSRRSDFYHNALSNLSLDNRPQDAQMLIDLSADFRYAKATVHVSSENHFGKLGSLAVHLRLFLSPVRSKSHSLNLWLYFSGWLVHLKCFERCDLVL